MRKFFPANDDPSFLFSALSDATVENPPRPKRWQFSLRTLLIGVLVASVVFGLIGRKVYWARVEAKRVNNLKQIGLAIHGYLDVWRCFPPAYIVDDNGRPMHSWRVLLLPYLEHVELHEQYDFNEPWDGPNNIQLADKMPDCYRCPTAPRSANQTVYVAAVGDRTMWPGARSRKLGDVLDGLSSSILLVETVHAPVHWMEPTDAEFDSTFAQILRESAIDHGTSDFRRYATLFGDASVKRIRSDINKEVFEWLFLIDDGFVDSAGPQ